MTTNSSVPGAELVDDDDDVLRLRNDERAQARTKLGYLLVHTLTTVTFPSRYPTPPHISRKEGFQIQTLGYEKRSHTHSAQVPALLSGGPSELGWDTAHKQVLDAQPSLLRSVWMLG